jgi:hypothetical protein
MHSNLSCNLRLTPTSRWAGLNLPQTSQVVQSLVIQDYHLLSLGLTTNLCLVQGLSMSRTSSWAPCSNFHLSAHVRFMNVVKLGIGPSPSFNLTTQVTMKATLLWFIYGPSLSESPSLEGSTKIAHHFPPL